MIRDYLNEGVDPDEDGPLVRCPGPAHPDSHGCGRFLSKGASLCPRCDDESRAWWAADVAEERARAAAQVARENAYWAAERAQHPDMVARCACCDGMEPCRFDGEAYTCVDSAACAARCREARPVVAVQDQVWPDDDLIF